MTRLDGSGSGSGDRRRCRSTREGDQVAALLVVEEVKERSSAARVALVVLREDDYEPLLAADQTTPSWRARARGCCRCPRWLAVFDSLDISTSYELVS